MQPGQSLDLSIPVSNYGSVMDSYLLGVGEEPDLSGWWANYSSSDSSNTTNTTPSWSASVSDVLMFGNSYTSANGLSSMLEELLRSAHSPSNTSDFTSGGWTIAGHWDDVNTSGSAQNLSLATGVWIQWCFKINLRFLVSYAPIRIGLRARMEAFISPIESIRKAVR